MILWKTGINLQSVDQGKRLIKTRLNHSKVLIVLDDVDHVKQLEALVGSHKWFGSGSRIVITTRDEHVLRAHKVDHVHPVTLLSRKEAIMLFNKYAYNQDNHLNDYENLSLNVVIYSNGLPLALKVLGSFLYDKDEKEWRSTLARLKDIPEMEIVEQLKISYDGLKDVEKELFLDIACFFRWRSIENKSGGVDAMEVFDACGYHPDIGIKVLTQKALITTVGGRFDMHDLVQEMAHYIVRGEHPNSPDKHSRVWKEEEIKSMYLREATMENNKTEAIKFEESYKDNGHLSPMCKILSNMKKLRWLQLKFEDLNDMNAEGPAFLSNELQYIRWVGYPSSPFPDSFQPRRLATLILENSLQTQLWKDYKALSKLKVLQLGELKNLLSTPDFVEILPCLQKLTLHECEKLVEIHPSIGKHTSLEHVCVSLCPELRVFPTIVCMEKLETLEISWCHECLEFPEIKSYMKSLVKLCLSNMGIDTLLSSIGDQCPNLIIISLSCCSYLKNKEVNFYRLKHLEEVELYHVRSELFGLQLVFPQLTHSLRKLDLTKCYLKDGDMSSICELSSLQELDLSQNDFTRLDFSLLQLTRLKILKLSFCKLLVELPKLPSGLFILKANGCKALTTIGDCFTNCKWLCDVSIAGGGVITDGSRLLQSMLEGSALKNDHSMFLRLEGLELAKAFRPPLVRGEKCKLKLPENWSNDYSGFLMCSGGINFSFYSLIMEQVLSGTDYKDDVVLEESDNDDDKRTWVWYVSFASIRHTAWWDSTYKELLFSLETQDDDDDYSGVGVGLIGRKTGSRSGSSETLTTEEESEISKYTPQML